MEQDVELVYEIPLMLECIRNLKYAEHCPVGIQNQELINEKVYIIPKKRVTQDLSFNRKKFKSVNQGVRENEIFEVIFVHSILRCLHLIHHIRWTQPNTRILCNKIDSDKAYRRLHTKAFGQTSTKNHTTK